MRVFLSWSGDRSHAVAKLLHEWLPKVIQSIEPWFSPSDIEKGAQWPAELNTQLATSTVGIVCVTPENARAPWLLFEAGALSKAMDSSRVCPLLFGLEPADLKGPLTQFQATRTTKEDITRLLVLLNRSGDRPLSPQLLTEALTVRWIEFQNGLDAIPAASPEPTDPVRPAADVLSELLDRVRAMDMRLAMLALGGYSDVNQLRQRALLRTRAVPSEPPLSNREKRIAQIQTELEGITRRTASLMQQMDTPSVLNTLSYLDSREKALSGELITLQQQADNPPNAGDSTSS